MMGMVPVMIETWSAEGPLDPLGICRIIHLISS
jgi:hypothetical protein